MTDDDLVSLRVALADLGITTASGIMTDVIDAKVLRLSRAEDASLLLELSFPCHVREDTVTAKYKTKSGLLIVSAQPVRSHQSTSDERSKNTAPMPPCTHEITACPVTGSPRPPNVPLNSLSGRSDDADDAELFREFADEAYAASLTIQCKHPATSGVTATLPDVASSSGRADNPSACGEPTVIPIVGVHGSQSLISGGDSESTATSSLRPPSSSKEATVSTSAPHAPADEGSVALAVGVDGTGLAAALGYPFEALPANISSSSGSAKKAKKIERKRASVAAAATLKSLADSLINKGWAACGEFACSFEASPSFISSFRLSGPEGEGPVWQFSIFINAHPALDNFIPADVVSKCREELKQMEQHYTPGQIWVGKEADSGAQIAVQDVRGDSVLWMDEQALTATAFIKDGKKRPCSFKTFHHVGSGLGVSDNTYGHETLQKYSDNIKGFMGSMAVHTITAVWSLTLGFGSTV